MIPDSHFIDSLPGYLIEELVCEHYTTRVFRARRLSDNKPVMLKAVRNDQAMANTVAALKHEYEIASAFQSPGIIRILGIEYIQQHPVVVLEDFGGSALSILMRQQQFSIEQVLDIGIKLVCSLGEVHAANIIHKDINPSNVVFNPDSGELKIIDFGISSYLTREQAAIANVNVVEASLPYLSPEQTGRMNRSVDYRSDYYSLGVTLFELLTGRLPFQVDEAIEWFHCHIAKIPPSPHEFNPQVPRALSNVILKLMSKMAEDRYQSATGIAADLQNCLDQLRSSGTIADFILGQQDVCRQMQIPQRLYGRERDVENLLDGFERVSQGANELVLVSGYSGIGKTCLIREVYKPITEHRGFFIAGKFDQLHRDVPYSALAVALRDLCRQILTESDARLAQWRSDLLAALGDNGQLMIDLVHELELIIGPQPAVPKLAPLESEQRFQHVFLSLIGVFSQSTHPLVLFLDDLQWADNASLNALELLNNPESRVPYLMVVGAYRDNEVAEGHPLLLSIKASEARGCPVSRINLQPLESQHIIQLLMDTFNLDRLSVVNLAGLLTEKTGGNPFFIEEFLKELYQQAVIQYDLEQGRWQWDLEQIQQQKITDNVVDLITQKLLRMEPAACELVQIASCIGNRFPLAMLNLVWESSRAQLEQNLKLAMRLGLIAPVGDAYQIIELEGEVTTLEFAFAHDRVHQAAYAMLDEGKKQAIHLRVGRLLLRSTNEEKIQEKVFDICNHLNLALPLISQQEEKDALLALNLRAGIRAKSSTAYQAAKHYLSSALELQHADAWESTFEQTRELYLEAAEAAYLCAEYSAMDGYLDSAFEHIGDLLLKVDFYLVKVSALIAQGKLKESLDLAKPVMAKFGHRYPANPGKRHVLTELFKTLWSLRKADPDAISKLPQMTDPNHLAAHALGGRIGAPAMFVQPELLPMMALRSVRIQQQCGPCELGLNSWAVVGMILAGQMNKPEKGLAYGNLSLTLAQRFQSRPMEGRAIHLYNALVRHWAEPLRNTMEPLQQAYRISLENGDFEYAMLALVVHMMNTFEVGADLNHWYQQLMELRLTIKQLRQGHSVDYVDSHLQFCSNFMGQADDPALLVGEHYNVLEKRHLHEQIGDKSLVIIGHALNVMALYHFGHYEKALEQVNTLSLEAANVGSFYLIARLYLMDSLVRLANVPLSQGSKRRRLLREVAKNQRKLKQWSVQNPDNFYGKYCLLKAEHLGVLGHDLDANSWFDKAIKASVEQGFLQDEALAAERCGRMHLAAGRITLAGPYLQRALHCYHRWGARAKCQHLLEAFPNLVRKPTEVHVGDSATTRTEHLANIDISALMKALKAIAEVKGHGDMIKMILNAALEFAGAQRGTLVLRSSDSDFKVEGVASVDSDETKVMQSIPLSESGLPLTLVNYVIRTQSKLVVHDAQEGCEEVPGLERDEIIKSSQVRSLLCMPIVIGAGEDREVIGLLYLEHELATGIFTEERFSTLEIITMSAAGRLELSRKASFDGLTGLFNHEYFQNVLVKEFSASKRYQQELGVLLVDIDHFKQFNDTWGHQVGDLVLKDVAQLLRANSRDCDVVARYGGEEMVVIMPSTPMPHARDVAERMRLMIQNHEVIHDGNVLRVTISAGLAMYDAITDSKDELIQRADEALYTSKREGRNRLTISDRRDQGQGVVRSVQP
ncbi:MAG: diguanylate cyclase [Ketobacter sp.]|nr:MAG: diguanylate cyclase [Ketobacter sp.]